MGYTKEQREAKAEKMAAETISAEPMSTGGPETTECEFRVKTHAYIERMELLDNAIIKLSPAASYRQKDNGNLVKIKGYIASKLTLEQVAKLKESDPVILSEPVGENATNISTAIPESLQAN